MTKQRHYGPPKLRVKQPPCQRCQGPVVRRGAAKYCTPCSVEAMLEQHKLRQREKRARQVACETREPA